MRTRLGDITVGRAGHRKRNGLGGRTLIERALTGDLGAGMGAGSVFVVPAAVAGRGIVVVDSNCGVTIIRKLAG